MSTAYFIIVNDDVDFDTYVSGKIIAQLADKLNRFCISNKLKPVDFYLHQDFSEFLDEDISSFDEDFRVAKNSVHDNENELAKNYSESRFSVDEDDPLENDDNISDAPEQEQVWFDPEKGIEWVDSLVSALQTQTPNFLSTELVAELLEYQEVLRKTQKAGLLWHLEMDY